MNKIIFVDSGALIGLANTKDQHYREALACFEELNKAPILFVTTNFILAETYNFIARKVNIYSAVQLGSALKAIDNLKVYTMDASLEKEAWNIFTHDLHHSFSYTDCTSFAFMRKHKIKEAFSFDQDFTSFGFITLPLRR